MSPVRSKWGVGRIRIDARLNPIRSSLHEFNGVKLMIGGRIGIVGVMGNTDSSAPSVTPSDVG